MQKPEKRFALAVGAVLTAALLTAGCDDRSADSGKTEHGRAAADTASHTPPKPIDTAALPKGVYVLARTTIPDPGVIAQMPALTALIPAGWTTQGGVIPAQGLCAEPYAVAWSAKSPDGRTMVEIFPTEVWFASNTGIRSDCRPGNYTSVRDYLEARVQQTFPGARVLDYRARDDLAKAASESAQQTQTMASQMGLNMRAWADGGEVLFGFEDNGVDMRGVLAATAVFYGSQLPNPMGGPPLQNITGSTLGTFGARAPNGQLDFALIEAVRRSVSPNADWLDKLFAIQNARGEAAVKGTRERAAMIVAGGAAATKSNIETFHAMTAASTQSGSDATSDRMQRESIEAIRGVETYNDPVGGGAVQLDATYDHAWRVNNQESYILTKDPNFNPGQFGIEATQMSVVQ